MPVDVGQRHAGAIAPNVLDRQFQARGQNRTWVADFTYLWTAEGWLYVAVVLDLYSRRAVGGSMQNEMTSQLVTDALMMAMWRRGKPDALLHHSDRGQPIHQRRFSAPARRAGRDLQHEPVRQRLGQRGDGELLLVA